jgi:hypothetical protein
MLIGLVASQKPYMSDSLEKEQNKIMREDVLNFYEPTWKNICRPRSGDITPGKWFNIRRHSGEHRFAEGQRSSYFKGHDRVGVLNLTAKPNDTAVH